MLKKTPGRNSGWTIVRALMLVLISAFLSFEGSGQVALRGTSTTATSTSSTLTISKPAGVVQGDIMLVNIATMGTASAASLSGWTVIRTASLSTSPRRYASVLYKIAGASEPASYSFATGSGTIGASGGIVAFSGVDNANPFDPASGSIRQTTATTVTANSLTTTRPQTAIVFMGQAVGSTGGSTVSWNTGSWQTVNSPGALTELFDNEESVNHVSVGAAWAVRENLGSTGNGTATLSASVRNGGVLVALRALDIFAPAVTATVPVANATGISITSSITATFNEPLDAATVNATSALLQAGTTLIPATVSYSSTNRRITITPTMPMAARTVYTVTLKGGSSGIKDLVGNPIATDYTWSFTSANPADQTPPRVSSTVPLSNAINVSLSTTVSAVFSEGLRATSVNSSTAYLQTGTTIVPATVTYSSTPRSVTITPSSPLLPGTVYTATMKGGVIGIKDSNGNPLATDYTWTFTTLTTDLTAPTVVSPH